jgi:hypothetical protein
MNDKDKVKFTIYTRSNGTIYIITSRELANQFREDVITNSIISGWYEISGRLNDIDSNEITITMNHEELSGFDIVSCNEKF